MSKERIEMRKVLRQSKKILNQIKQDACRHLYASYDYPVINFLVYSTKMGWVEKWYKSKAMPGITDKHGKISGFKFDYCTRCAKEL